MASGKAAGFRCFSAVLIAVLSLFSLTAAQAAARTEPEKNPPRKLRTITTAREAHSLNSKEAARAYPVHLRAVVTYFDPNVTNNHPNSLVHSNLFVHDATGSIYVSVVQGTIRTLPVGSLIDLQGVTSAGEFGPIIAQPKVKVIGHAALPENPLRPNIVSLLSGTEDGQWVEVEGIVHSVVEDNYHVGLQLTLADGNITVVLVKEPGITYSGLVDAKLRIRAHAAPKYDSVRKQMIGVRLMCPDFSAIKILQSAPEDPFKQPVIPIDRLLQWDMAPLLVHRVHVQGRVILQWPGSSVCIQNAEQGICAQTDQSTRLRIGEMVDLAGFVKAEVSVPALTDAVYKSVGSAATEPVSAVPVTAEQALQGGHESQLIQIDAQLISRDLASADTTLLLSSGKFLFKAVLPQGLAGAGTNTWENGSILRITGICSVQLDVQGNALALGTAVPTSFRVLMRSPADVVVVKSASWWTPVHALAVLSLVLVATLGALALVLAMRKRLERQTRLLREQAVLLREQTQQLRESEERFRHMALHDGLTGLATRLLLRDRIGVAIENARRHQTGLSLLMVDLDRFKEINDTFGHQAGDQVLRVTADRLLKNVRKSDTVARIGGDEFVVLLAEVSNPKTLEKTAASIVKTLAVPILFEGREMPVSVSVGTCAASSGELDADVLLKYADDALYRAKERGRNCYAAFTPGEARVQMAPAGPPTLESQDVLV